MKGKKAGKKVKKEKMDERKTKGKKAIKIMHARKKTDWYSR